MHSNNVNHNELRNKLDLFLSKWKLILLCFCFCLGFAYIYLRYANYQYRATTIIKINTEENSNKKSLEISLLQSYEMFSSNVNNIIDEIEIIKSKSLLEKVVVELKLNIKYFVRGKIKEQEIYSDLPINLSFFESDSLINTIDTTLYIKIKSPTKFTLSKTKRNELLDIENSDSKEYEFGDRIITGFGDFIITPNIGNHSPKIGSSIKIQMKPVSEVVESYQKRIIVSPTSKTSSILRLTLNENLKNKAKYILDKLVEKYNEDVINDRQLIVKATSNFINNRLDIVSKELGQVDFTAETMQKNNRLTALASQSNIFLQSEKENENRIINTTSQIQLISYLKEYLAEKKLNSDLLPADVGIIDNSISQITKNHNELVLQRNRILKNSTEKNPTIINLNNQISAFKENLSQSLNNIENVNKIKLNSLNKEEARISSQIYSAPTKARQFKDVKRQQDIKESLFMYLLQKREETAILFGLSSPNAKIVDTAFTTTLPVSPKPSIVYLAAFLLGLAIPIGIIHLFDILDSKIHDKKGLAKILTMPFLGDIPKSSTKNIFINKLDYSPKAEAFRLIRTNIDFLMHNTIKSKGKTIFVTSTTSKEGKSHTTINLAKSLSYSNKKVLIIEADIRVPKLIKYLELKDQKGLGLTNFILEDKINFADVIHKVSSNLDIIPCGTIPPNPAELLMDEKLEILFNAVKNKYDYIVVDTAAVGLVTDTLLISKFADMVIYVVRAHYIDKRQLNVAQSMYDEKRLPNMVILLNAVVHKKGYGYGYGNIPKKKFKFF